MDKISQFKETKIALDKVSTSYCVAKWNQVTIHLGTGMTHSCHHPTVHKIYTASKSKHGPMWVNYKMLGNNIISTWIFESGAGETEDFSDLWVRCVKESSE